VWQLEDVRLVLLARERLVAPLGHLQTVHTRCACSLHAVVGVQCARHVRAARARCLCSASPALAVCQRRGAVELELSRWRG
jgi:hypothetical protein